MKPKHIILDPGHVGGTWFDLRTLKFGKRVFREGDFCMTWAIELSRQLESIGIKCTLTHEPGRPYRVLSNKALQTRLNSIPEDQVAQNLKKFRVPIAFFPENSKKQLLAHAIQNEYDLIGRAEFINTSEADFVISLHLNGEEKTLITDKNGVCGLTNTKSFDYYTEFSQIVSALAFSVDLSLFQMDGLNEVNKGLYLDENLTLMKYVEKPILLIEGPFQNNNEEFEKLYPVLENNYAYSGRIKQLTDGVLNGIVGRL